MEFENFGEICPRYGLGVCWINLHIWYQIWSVYMASSGFWSQLKGWRILSLKHVQIISTSGGLCLTFGSTCVIMICLTHWRRVTHICVRKLTAFGSDNGLLPGRRQAIIWTNAGILLIRTFGTNFSDILIEIHTFSFTQMHLKMSSGKWRTFYLGLNVLTPVVVTYVIFNHQHQQNAR